jgi:hypothetical protein
LGFEVGALCVPLNAGIDMGIEGDKESIGLILIKDFDSLGIGLVIEEGDIFFDQIDGSFIDSTLKRNGSVAVDFSPGPGAEEVREVFGGRSHEVKMPGVTIPRRLLGGAMSGSMIGLITPVFEPFIQGGEGKGGRKEGKKLHS